MGNDIDVAKLAGMSVSTVSKVINNKPHVLACTMQMESFFVRLKMNGKC
ncbi:LacI family DNA-binding transcriptional regulator [Eubacterium ramulus]